LERAKVNTPAATADIIADRLKTAYAEVQAHQLRMAAKNAKYRDKKLRASLRYETGDSVYFWDPYSGDVSGVPEKHRLRWSGPHVLTERIDAVRFRMVRSDNQKEVVVNINRLQPTYFWSSDRPLTDPPYYGLIDDTYYRPPKDTAKMKKGWLFIVQLVPNNADAMPWCVAKCTKRKQDGQIEYQWYGNYNNDIMGLFRPTWQRADGTTYASEESDKESDDDEPFMGSDSGCSPLFAKDADVIYARGFKLLPSGKIPTAIYTILHDSPNVDWSLPIN
jgi:hypothetical protein